MGGFRSGGASQSRAVYAARAQRGAPAGAKGLLVVAPRSLPPRGPACLDQRPALAGQRRPSLTEPVVSDNTGFLEIRFTQPARKHRIGRTSARHVLATAEPNSVSTTSGADAWLYAGPDERGRELEVIALEVYPADGERPYLLVIHVMPTQLRGDPP